MDVIKIKWFGERQHKSNEGLTTDKNGKTVHNDYWLHKEFMEDEDREVEEDSRQGKNLAIDLREGMLTRED